VTKRVRRWKRQRDGRVWGDYGGCAPLRRRPKGGRNPIGHVDPKGREKTVARASSKTKRAQRKRGRHRFLDTRRSTGRRTCSCAEEAGGRTGVRLHEVAAGRERSRGLSMRRATGGSGFRGIRVSHISKVKEYLGTRVGKELECKGHSLSLGKLDDPMEPECMVL